MHIHSQLRTRILSVIMALLAVVYVIVEFDFPGDFRIYFEASKDLFLSKNIYTEHYGESKVFPYYGSPTLAFLIGSLSLFPLTIASVLWKLASGFFLYRIWILLESYFDLSGFSKKEYTILAAGSFISVSFMIYRNFHLSQFTIFLLYSLLEGINFINSGKKWAGSLLLSLGIIAKVLPIIIIPYLIYRKEFKSLGYVLIFTLLLMLMPSLGIGWDGCVFLTTEWFKTINPAHSSNIFDVNTNDIHGLTTLISTLFIKGIGIDEYTLQLQRHVLNLSPDTVTVIIQVVRASLIVFTLYFLRTWPFKASHNSMHRLWELSFIFLITPLIFPQQRLYAFFFAFPAIVYLNYNFILKNKERTERSMPKPLMFYIYLLALVIFNLELILGNFREYYWHFKTVTYAMLIILTLLTILKPDLKTEKQVS